MQLQPKIENRACLQPLRQSGGLSNHPLQFANFIRDAFRGILGEPLRRKMIGRNSFVDTAINCERHLHEDMR